MRKEMVNPMKIAVCDDDKAAREHIVALIKEQIQDAEIMTFATGEEMLKVQSNFDISFLDVEMRGISGMDVAEHIRQEEQGKAKSIINVTTWFVFILLYTLLTAVYLLAISRKFIRKDYQFQTHEYAFLVLPSVSALCISITLKLMILSVEKSLKDTWLNTTSSNPYNDFLLTVMSGLSQLERDLISQCTKEGLVSAKARGRNGGRPSKQNEKAEMAVV